MNASAILRQRRALRWSVPTCVAGVIALAAAGVFTAAATSEKLPSKTPAALLADVQSARVTGFSGTIVAQMSLGLPSLPDIGGSGPSGGQSSLMSLLSGSHTMRFWYDGPDRQRLALLGTTNETDLFHSGRDLWQWDSDGHVATHTVLPAGRPGPMSVPTGQAGSTMSTDLTPQQIADRAIKAITPSTEVTVASNRRVAHRAAYELVLTPRDAATLVGSVRIAIDGSNKLPLGVQVFARGSESPAIDVSFSNVTFKTPAASNFDFTPPPGAVIHQGGAAKPDAGSEHSAKQAPDARGTTTAIGSGWTAIAECRATPAQITKLGGPLLGQLKAVQGAWGHGRLVKSALLSVLVTDDGRVFAGSVDPSALYAAAATHK